ncbi:MAG: hemerythrin domain-containing protein [Rhodoferax sp.]|nr:hemerythrin domain-containing protein [Rhodoferax sp.]
MATKAASNGRSRKASTSGKTRAGDALALMRSDHEHVSGLFGQFDKARSSTRKKTLARQICQELTVHAQVEEEIFYPAFRKATRDKSLVPEATVEHQTMKDLIAQIEKASPDAELFDAKVTVLGEYVKHHVKEEQNEIFPKARKSTLPLKELGEQMRQRKDALMASRH